MTRSREARHWIAPIVLIGLGTVGGIYSSRSDRWHPDEKLWAGFVSFT